MSRLDEYRTFLRNRTRPARPKHVGVLAAVTVVAVGVAWAGTAWLGTGWPGPAAEAPVAGPAVPSTARGQLARLADVIETDGDRQVGDATLVLRSQSYPGTAPIGGADLYTDSGGYYHARDRSGLPAQVRADANQGDGVFAREVAAALSASAGGDLTAARDEMADAALDPDTTPSRPAAPEPTNVAVTDNHVWQNSLGAFDAGAGNPRVRAGALRILATAAGVVVSDTTTDGRSTLTLTAGPPVLPGDYQETLTVDAHTGVPMRITGGVPGRPPATTVDYQVSRVRLADVAAGRF
jgi:hypothetical protein